jgi:hypothetical protein
VRESPRTHHLPIINHQGLKNNMKIAPEQLSQIYEKDYFLWLEETIKLLRNRVSAITVTNNRKMELRNPVSRPQDLD